jgi:hypothetical protein
MRLLTLAWVVVFSVIVGTSAHATTWYVNSAGGSDSNNGETPGTPFLTLQHAAGVTAAGDTVDVFPGNGYGGGTGGTAPLIISTSGSGAGTTPGTPCTSQITYQSHYNGTNGPRTIINGTEATTGAIQGEYPLSCITISGFEIIGSNGAQTWAGASANAGLTGTTWETSGAFNGDGIFFGGGTSGHTLHHIIITNVVVHDFPLDGIACNFCDYVTVTNNTVYNNGLYSGFAGSGISLYELHNIDAGTGTKNVISGNTTYGNVDYIPNLAGGTVKIATSAITASGGTLLTFTASTSGTNYTMAVVDVTNGCIPPGDIVSFYSGNNVNLSLPTTCQVGSGDTILFDYVTDGEGIIIDNNSNTQSDSIAYVGRTLTTNNVIYNNGGPAIECGPQSNHCDTTFNTAYFDVTSQALNGSAPAEYYAASSTDTNIYNNVFYSLSTIPSGWDQSTSTATFSNNLFFGGNASHPLPGSNNVLTNPNFVAASIVPGTANFQISPGSPAIDAGSSTYTRTTDYAGNPGLVGPSYDIGAYESPCSTYGASTISNPSTLIGSQFQDAQAAGSITPLRMRNLISTLSCGRSPWAH